VTVRAGRAGETSPSLSFDEIMRAHGEALRSLCARLLGDETLAEDVAQQVFLEAHRDLLGFEQRASLRTWLCGIAVHRCQDALKARRRYTARVTSDELQVETCETSEPDPGTWLERSRLWEALHGGLAALSPEARLAVTLRFQHDLSYEEMARTLGEKADTLNARVTRAISVLRRDLERKGWSL
jgi:RNA polymerase sigma-70 factor (ECF subfamily)